jgi:D-glycero-D-manno-heptose 1,7-bisphosphate phosphatase
MLVILDRDGVINVDNPRGILRVEEFQFLPRAVEGIALLKRAGCDVAVCTNQSAISKGDMTMETLEAIHAHMQAQLAAAGARIDRIYFAPDHPDAVSTRRKPAPGMLLEALADFAAEAKSTPMVGDMLRDMEAALAVGCPRILTRTGKGAALEAKGIPPHLAPITVCDDLFAAAQHILRGEGL